MAAMAAQFGLNLTPELHERLPDIFPKASGRDVKGLAKQGLAKLSG